MSKATRAELRQFNIDVETVQNSLGPALTYLGAEERFATACEDLRNRWQAAKTCGETLKRIHDRKSYRDSYPNSSAFCCGLNTSRVHIYRLMKCAEVLATIPPALIGKIEIALSFRLVGGLGKLEAGERAKLVRRGCGNPDQ
jgi:hypothetical protein